ncbi:MAG TPA: tetratricopeptide repeat protein [Pyrinomonadaceae bacterium]|nr:tetratricopeptide repeat protein [Pyrinomonadaceae bacterium]
MKGEAREAAQMCYEFGPFRPDTGGQEMLLDGRPVGLTPKAERRGADGATAVGDERSKMCGKFIGVLLLAAALLLQPVAARQQEQTDDPAEARRLSAQVVRLYAEGKYDEALPLARRALKIREKALGRDHQLTAAAAVNLAEQYWAKGKYDEAEPLLRRVLPAFEKASGEEAGIAGGVLERLAILSASKRDPSEAEGFYLRALSARERAHGPSHEQVVSILNSLASFYRTNGRPGKAVPLLRRVAEIRERAHGPSHRRVGEALQRLACFLHKDKQKGEAERVEARANEILYADAAAKPEPVALPHEAFMCKVISNPSPEFPAAAMRGRAGAVTARIAVVVNEAGEVESARMVEGDAVMKKPSERAALKARFMPTLVGGRPVKMSGEIVHGFYTTTSTVVVGPVPVRR